MAYSDDFTGTDGDDLGTRGSWAFSGTGGASAAEINASNQLKCAVTTAGRTLFYIDNASANHWSQVDRYSVTTTGCWLSVRSTDQNNGIHVQTSGTGKLQLYKYVTASFTQLGSDGATTVNSGDTVYIEADGNSITVKLNASTEIGPETETFNNTETQQGIFVRGCTADPIMDNFDSDVMAAASGRIMSSLAGYGGLAGRGGLAGIGGGLAG